MKLGFCSLSALDRPLAAVAEAAAKAGADSLEVTARVPHLDPESGVETAREAGRVVRAAGLEVVAYGSYLGCVGSTDDAALALEVERAVALGTDLLRVWAEPLPPEPGDLEPVIGWLRKACAVAAGQGVSLVVERHIGSWADTPERCEALLQAVDRTNLALNYQVLDFLPEAAWSGQAEDAGRLVPLARYFHVKNYRPNPDGGGALPGGSLEGGVLDYEPILRAALAGGYTGPFTIEFLSWDDRPLEEKLAEDVRALRALLKRVSPDSPIE